MGHDEGWQEERLCQQCQLFHPLTAFARSKGKSERRKSICNTCEQRKQQERHHRLALQRIKDAQQPERTEHRVHVLQQQERLRQSYEERQREKECWYLQQPDRCCRLCQYLLPATAFDCTNTPDGFLLQTRCRACHEVFRAERQECCCLCQRKTARQDFLSHYEGYALSGNGAWISLCCRGCEATFGALAPALQQRWIAQRCQRSFPSGQVIYAEVDPQTGEIRYIGRTSRPKRRHAQHVSDVAPVAGPWYTRRNWMHTLAQQGLAPSMQVLHPVEVSPLVLAWERRYILHGLQQGWPLLNNEMMDAELVARVKASSNDFLQAPFQLLVQQHFFAVHGLEAFLHQWSQPERLAG